jgi:hypothetical protein
MSFLLPSSQPFLGVSSLDLGRVACNTAPFFWDLAVTVVKTPGADCLKEGRAVPAVQVCE